MEEVGRELTWGSFPAGSKNGRFQGLLALEHGVLVGRPLTHSLAAVNLYIYPLLGLGLAWAEAGSS